MTAASEDRAVAGARRGQLRQPRLADVVASVLRERIVDGQLGDGDLLPKQDELLKEFRISRPSLREALRILESEGLISVRRGNVGGSVIEVPTAETSAYTFGLVLQSRRGTVADLAVAIKHTEPIAAGLCAARADRETQVLPALRENLDRSAAAEGGEEFIRLAREFHQVLAASCGNQTMALILSALDSLWIEQERQWGQRSRAAGRTLDDATAAEVLRAHKALVRAIEGGQEDRARKLMAGHLEHRQDHAADFGEAVVRATSLRNGLRDISS